MAALALWGAMAVCTGGCSRCGTGGTGPPSVLLISVDTLRPDHLSAYGYNRRTSPNIDRLASDGILFLNAISTTSWTLPAHVSMLTSLYPDVHGVIRGRERLSENAILCSEYLKEAGYRTYGVVSGPFLNNRYGYNQGFDVYDDMTVSFQSKKQASRGSTSPYVHRRAVEILDGHANTGPFFLFLHYWDPHYDYAPPSPYDDMYDPEYSGDFEGEDLARNERLRPDMNRRDLDHLIALYDGEIAYTDEHIGKILTRLREQGLYDRMLIILTSDHGEEFFEHGNFGHRKSLFGETLRVPLIVKLPRGQLAGRRVSSTAGIIDILPTILDVAHLTPRGGIHGRSLLGVPAEPREETSYYADLFGSMKCAQSGPWKLIKNRGPGYLLYHLPRDPGEKHDLQGEAPQELARARAELSRWLEETSIERRHFRTRKIEHDRATEEMLESLGYGD
ncbi:MAG: sulfatase [Acidobacteria bacterium]|nr:sulfatase [Acidobacteriota bacterium]